MGDGEASAIWIILLIGLGAWVLLGTPMRDVRGWFGIQTYEDQFEILADHVNKKKIGSTPDFWLTKTSIFGSQDRVALVFGLLGDDEFCQDIAELYMQKYPDSHYYCLPANSE